MVGGWSLGWWVAWFRASTPTRYVYGRFLVTTYTVCNVATFSKPQVAKDANVASVTLLKISRRVSQSSINSQKEGK